jgi:hypothetical protein
LLGDGCVVFCVVGTSGIDFALGGHEFSFVSTSMLGLEVEMERAGFLDYMKMVEI